MGLKDRSIKPKGEDIVIEGAGKVVVLKFENKREQESWYEALTAHAAYDWRKVLSPASIKSRLNLEESFK
jgi:hypothetical protein